LHPFSVSPDECVRENDELSHDSGYGDFGGFSLINEGVGQKVCNGFCIPNRGGGQVIICAPSRAGDAARKT